MGKNDVGPVEFLFLLCGIIINLSFLCYKCCCKRKDEEVVIYSGKFKYKIQSFRKFAKFYFLAPVAVTSQPINHQNMSQLHPEAINSQTPHASAPFSLQNSSVAYQLPSCPPQSQNAEADQVVIDLPPPSYNDALTQLSYNPNFKG